MKTRSHIEMKRMSLIEMKMRSLGKICEKLVGPLNINCLITYICVNSIVT